MSKCDKAKGIIDAFQNALPKLEDFGELEMEIATCEEARKELDELEAKLNDSRNQIATLETDVVYYKSIVDGSWPQATEILQRSNPYVQKLEAELAMLKNRTFTGKQNFDKSETITYKESEK